MAEGEDHARVKAGLEAYVAATERLKLLEAENEAHKADIAVTKSSLEHYQHAHAQMQAERDHYMRLATELTVALKTAAAVITGAAGLAAQAPYRPNGKVPARLTHDTEVPASDDEPLRQLRRLVGETEARSGADERVGS